MESYLRSDTEVESQWGRAIGPAALRRGAVPSTRDATETPWRTEADAPACFGPDGRTIGTVIRDARDRRVLRLCRPGTRGAQAVQAAAAAAAIVTLANSATATMLEAGPIHRATQSRGRTAGETAEGSAEP